MRADDLLIMLEVARSRSFVQAGVALGMDHTTVSRRIASLEKELGDRVVDRSLAGVQLTSLGRAILPAAEQVARAMDVAEQTVRPDRSVAGHVRVASPEAFGARFVAPAMARLHQQHPGVSIELVAATRPLGQATGVDVEIGVGTPTTRRFEVTPLADYSLSLYASTAYLERAGTPTLETLTEHPVIYYIDALQRVDELGLADAGIPVDSVQIGSTSVLVQHEATIAGGGVGLLPDFLARSTPGLVRLLSDEVRLVKPMVALLPPRVLRRPAAIAFMATLVREIAERRLELLEDATG
ncbi:LysR family transcriptional regulator [Nocardioides zeae]|uniref:LysR family transcriptional regulator n=1 Tax=Nocardioides imazamoxiresistens TaxID=3231893 RepID=A0ABU3PYY0_9ACTN|nr:LysR family transcriptional regulator [Nocardioides zeae]MDT9594081.1 LysR family transcriptional regulator [Nocardioides zeae]